MLILLGVLVTLCNNLMSFSFHSYQSELFPTRIRSRAIGFVYSWSRLSAALSGLVVAFLLNLGGVNAVFAFIAFAMAIVVATIGGLRSPHPRPRARSNRPLAARPAKWPHSCCRSPERRIERIQLQREAKFLKWYDFEAIFYSNTRLAALHTTMRPLDESGYQGVTARPRIRPRIDNPYSTQQ